MTGPESDWFRAWSVIIIAVYVSRVCIRVGGSCQVQDFFSRCRAPDPGSSLHVCIG